MRKALIIIDMLNDFVDKDGALYVQGAETLVPNINKLIESFSSDSRSTDITFICDSHKEDDIEFKIWPKHAVKGTLGAKKHSSLIIPDFWDEFYKTDLSIFTNKNLEKILKDDDVGTLYIAGVATDYCVVNSVLNSTSKTGELVLGAISRGYKVNIVVDAIAGVDEIPGVSHTKGKVAESLIKMGAAGVNVVYTEDIIND